MSAVTSPPKSLRKSKEKSPRKQLFRQNPALRPDTVGRMYSSLRDANMEFRNSMRLRQPASVFDSLPETADIMFSTTMICEGTKRSLPVEQFFPDEQQDLATPSGEKAVDYDIFHGHFYGGRLYVTVTEVCGAGFALTFYNAELVVLWSSFVPSTEPLRQLLRKWKIHYVDSGFYREQLSRWLLQCVTITIANRELEEQEQVQEQVQEQEPKWEQFSTHTTTAADVSSFTTEESVVNIDANVEYSADFDPEPAPFSPAGEDSPAPPGEDAIEGPATAAPSESCTSPTDGAPDVAVSEAAPEAAPAAAETIANGPLHIAVATDSASEAGGDNCASDDGAVAGPETPASVYMGDQREMDAFHASHQGLHTTILSVAFDTQAFRRRYMSKALALVQRAVVLIQSVVRRRRAAMRVKHLRAVVLELMRARERAHERVGVRLRRERRDNAGGVDGELTMSSISSQRTGVAYGAGNRRGLAGYSSVTSSSVGSSLEEHSLFESSAESDGQPGAVRSRQPFSGSGGSGPSGRLSPSPVAPSPTSPKGPGSQKSSATEGRRPAKIKLRTSEPPSSPGIESVSENGLAPGAEGGNDRDRRLHRGPVDETEVQRTDYGSNYAYNPKNFYKSVRLTKTESVKFSSEKAATISSGAPSPTRDDNNC